MARDLPLEEVAERLGLQRDRHDKHKWLGERQIISINDQKFYDHLALKGGYGAIDLVMHVQGRNFKEALDWLSNGASYLPPPQQRAPQQKPPLEEQKPFQPPSKDESKWAAVREYLVKKRKLPEVLVMELHLRGIIYADAKQNAVFVRKSLEGEITGASLRGTYKDSSFKGLATGTRRDLGWFSFLQGDEQLERIVLVESPVDAISAAALAKQQTGVTMFMSIDGAGAAPLELLRYHSKAGVRVVVGYDADSVGEEMARQVIEAVPGAVRVKPHYGKDWNEHLVHQVLTIEAVNQLSDQNFLQLHRNLVEYFHSRPPRPPSDTNRQLVQSEISKLSSQINDLWMQQASQVQRVEAMQKNPLRAWNKEYDAAIGQLEKTMGLISQSVAQKDQKESQLKEWAQQGEAYQAWEKDPRTNEMRSLALVFKQPQIQQRLIHIQQQLQQQVALRQNQQQQRGRGLSL